MQVNRVPAEPIRALVCGWMRQHHVEVVVIAEKIGVTRTTLEDLLNGRSKTFDFNTADALLCATGQQHSWRNKLEDIYYGCILIDAEPEQVAA